MQREEFKPLKENIVKQLSAFERDLSGMTSMATWMMMGLTQTILMVFKKFEDNNVQPINKSLDTITGKNKDG